MPTMSSPKPLGPSLFAGCLLAAIPLLASSAHADTKTWNDSGIDWWNSPTSNWTGGLPGSDDDAVIGLGGTAYFLNGSNSIRSLYVGGTTGSPGTAGAGTVRWDDDSNFFTSGTSFIGNNGNAGTVQATKSRWTSAADIIIGSSGTGLLDIAGGQVSNTFSFIGADAGVTGTVNVTGAGSTWTQSAGVIIGHNGIGSLNISGGGVVTNKEAVIGRYRTLNGVGQPTNTSQGTVVVTGAGSVWSNSDNVIVGAEGKGTLTIQNGGLVRVGWNGTAATGTLTLGLGGGSDNVLNIGATGSTATTTVTAGTLMAATVTGGSGTGTETVNFNHTDSAVFAASLTGGLKVQAIGTGTAILTGANTYTGGTSINNGSTLQIGNGGTTGTISGTISSGGTLAFNRSDDTSFALTFASGSANIAQIGAGTVTLTGAMTNFTGSFTPAAGRTLVLSNTYTSNQFFRKYGDGTLLLSGAADAANVLVDAGTLRVGNGSTAGSLVSSGGISLNPAGVIAFDRSDDVVFSSAITGFGGITKLNSNKLTLASVNITSGGLTTISAGTLVIESGTSVSSTTGAGKLIKTTTGTLRLGSGTSAAMGHTGGTEVQAGKLEFNSYGTIAGNIAVSSGATFDFSSVSGGNYDFGGSFSGAGTVSVSAGGTRTLPVASLSGFTGTFALNSSNTGFVFDTATAAGFSNAITGTGVFGKKGAGTLTYTGTAGNTGGFSVSAGRLTLGNGGTAGTYSTSATASAAISRDATLAFDRSDDFTFAGMLTGQGTFAKAGAGTLTLTTTLDSFTGTLAVEGGTLALSTAANTTLNGAITGGGKFIKQGGTTFVLRSDNARNDVIAYDLTIAGGTFTMALLGNTTYSGDIDGAGAFNYNPNSGNSSLTYTGTATHTGGTTIGNGSLRIGDGGTAGSISGDIAIGVNKLSVNRSDAVTLASKLTGTGTLANAGTGNATFTGNLTGLSGNTFDVTGTGALILGSAYSSASTITKTGSGKLTLADDTAANVALNAGTLQIGNGGTTGTLAGNISSTGGVNAVRFDRTDDFTYAGTITGAVTLVKSGSNNVALTGNISSASATTIAGGRLIIGNANNWSFAGTISGDGTLQKNGAGRVSIEGNASHTGGTFVNAGTLYLGSNGRLAGTATVAGDATLSLYGRTYALDVTGGGNLETQPSADVILTGIATHTGATTFNGGSLAVGDSRDFTFGSTTGGNGTLKKTGSGTMTSTGTFGHTTTTVAAGTLVTASLGTGTTTVESGATLRINPSSAATLGGAIANSGAFDKAGANTLTLTDAFSQTSGGVTTISGGTLALTYSTGTTSLAGTLQGAGAFEKRGAGTLNLTGTPGYTGGTVVTAGKLLIATGSALAGNVTVASGATFGIANNYIFGGAISGAGGFESRGDVTLTGTLTYTGNTDIQSGWLILNTAADTTLSGSLTGNNGALRKNSASTLTLSGDGGAFTGVIEVNAGALRLAAANNIGGQIWLNGGSLTTDATARTFSGQLEVVASSSIGGNGGDLTLSGQLVSNPGATLTKSGTNTVILTSANSFSQATIIDGGTLRLSGDGRLNASPGHDLTVNTGGTFDVGANTNVSRHLILDGGTLAGTTGKVGVGGTGSMTLRSGVVDAILDAGASTTLNKTTSGTVTLSRANTYTGNTLITGGLINFAALENFGPTGTIHLDGGGLQWAAGNTLDITSSSRFNRAYGNAGAIFDTHGNNIAFANAVTGTGTFTKAGAGTLTLAASALHAGNTVINGGVLAFDSSNDLVYAGTISGAGTLTKSGGSKLTLSNAHSYTGATVISGGTLVLGGDSASSSFAIASGAVLDLNVTAGERFYTGGTTGTTFSGTGVLRKTGSGTTIWAGSSAVFNLGAGSLIDVQAGNLYGGSNANEVWTGNQAGLHVAAGAFFSGVEANVRVDALTGAGEIRSGFNDAGYQTFTFGVADGSGTFAGVLADTPGGFHAHYVKEGSGTQILGGASTYTGATTVSEGMLVVNGSLANTAVTVASGATLGGSGTIGGLATFESGAHLAPGNSPGTLTFTNGLTLNDGAILDFQLGTASDLIVVSGGVLSADGTITVNLTDSGGFTAGTYTLIDATGASLSSIGATSFDLATTIEGYTYTFAQNGDLFQLTATSAVPEPATYAALAGIAMLGLVACKRRRRRS